MTDPGQPCVMISGSAFTVARLDVDEVDVHAVDLRHELRKGVQLRLGLSPVVVRRPVADERFERRELHALRPILDELLGGPPGRRETPAEVGEVRLRHVDAERPDRGLVSPACSLSCGVAMAWVMVSSLLMRSPSPRGTF